jgi:hypothetical protein
MMVSRSCELSRETVREHYCFAGRWRCPARRLKASGKHWATTSNMRAMSRSAADSPGAIGSDPSATRESAPCGSAGGVFLQTLFELLVEPRILVRVPVATVAVLASLIQVGARIPQFETLRFLAISSTSRPMFRKASMRAFHSTGSAARRYRSQRHHRVQCVVDSRRGTRNARRPAGGLVHTRCRLAHE